MTTGARAPAPAYLSSAFPYSVPRNSSAKSESGSSHSGDATGNPPPYESEAAGLFIYYPERLHGEHGGAANLEAVERRLGGLEGDLYAVSGLASHERGRVGYLGGVGVPFFRGHRVDVGYAGLEGGGAGDLVGQDEEP